MGVKSRNVIPIEVKRKCVELANNGLSAREIYKDYYSKHCNTKFDSFRRMLRRWKNKVEVDDEILETGNLSYNFIPHATTVQINSDGEIVQSWIKSKAEDRLYIELIENIKQLPKIQKVDVKHKESEPYMLEIPLYDMHWGIADYEYYKATLQNVLEIISRRHYQEINIIIGQDMFHNDDFRGRTASGREIEPVNMVKAWNDARQFYYNIIDASLEQSGKVKVIYSKGNHDESMSWAFVQMIKAQYDIEVDDELKERKVIIFGDNFIGITHGDKAKNKPIDLRSIFTIEYPIEFANAKVREIHAGHLHHEKEEDCYGVMCRRLSTSNKTDKWHLDNGYVGAHKRFTLFEWSLSKLVAIYYV